MCTLVRQRMHLVATGAEFRIQKPSNAAAVCLLNDKVHY